MTVSTITLKVLLLSSILAACSAFGFGFGESDKNSKGPPAVPPTPVVPVATTPSGARTNAESTEPHYTFRYVVQDARTGDYKSQEERRDGGHVRGTYSVAEPNGDLRVVSYSADKDSGFRAEVRVEPAGSIPVSQTPEGRTFANFLTNPFNLFRSSNYFSQKPQQVAVPVPVASSHQHVYTAERPVYTEKPVYDNIPSYGDHQRPPVYTEHSEDYPLYPVYDRTRLSEAPAIPITPASAYQFLSKPIQADVPVYSKPEDFSGFRPHLPETPAIPITPSPEVPQSDIITAPVKNPYQSKFPMLRRPVPRPTVSTPLRGYSTPVSTSFPAGTYPPSSPFPFMRYSPGVMAQPIQRIQQQNYWQNTPQYTYGVVPGGMQPAQGYPGYMLVRTYLVPVPPGRVPPNFVPVQMQPVTQPIVVPTADPVRTTQVKATSAPVPVETDTPITTVATGSMQTTAS